MISKHQDTKAKNDKTIGKDSPSERLITFGLERINQDSAVNVVENYFQFLKFVS